MKKGTDGLRHNSSFYTPTVMLFGEEIPRKQKSLKRKARKELLTENLFS